MVGQAGMSVPPFENPWFFFIGMSVLNGVETPFYYLMKTANHLAFRAGLILLAVLAECCPIRPASAGEPRAPTPGETVEIDEEAQKLSKLVQGGQAEIPKIIAALSAQPPETPGADAAIQIRALRQLKAENAVAVLTKIAFASTDQEVAKEAWMALGDLGSPADLPAMLPILDAPKELKWKKLYAQKAAIEAIVAIGSKPGGDTKLVEQFGAMRIAGSSISRIRQIDVLGKVRTTSTRNLLCTYFADADPDVQRVAVDTVDFVEAPLLRKDLITWLDSPSALLQKAAILCVGRSGMINTIPKLVALMDSKVGGVQGNAQWSLLRLTGKKFDTSADAKTWLEAETASGEAKFEELKKNLTSVSARELPLVVEDLSKLPLQREKVTLLLLPLLQNKDFRVRAAACDALAKSDTGFQILRALVNCMRDPNDVVVASAWRTLKELAREERPKSAEAWQHWLTEHGY